MKQDNGTKHRRKWQKGKIFNKLINILLKVNIINHYLANQAKKSTKMSGFPLKGASQSRHQWRWWQPKVTIIVADILFILFFKHHVESFILRKLLSSKCASEEEWRTDAGHRKCRIYWGSKRKRERVKLKIIRENGRINHTWEAVARSQSDKSRLTAQSRTSANWVSGGSSMMSVKVAVGVDSVLRLTFWLGVAVDSGTDLSEKYNSFRYLF